MTLRPAAVIVVLCALPAGCGNDSAKARPAIKQPSPMSPARRDALTNLRALQATADARFALRTDGDAFVGAELTSAPLRFDARGARVEAPLGSFALRLSRFGRSTLQSVASVAPSAEKNRVTFRYGAIQEWYENGPAGLEQGFDIAERPGGDGPLVLEYALAGARPAARGEAVDLHTDGGVAATVDNLFVLDADGREVPARFAVHDGALRIDIDDEGARYPLSVDPLIGIARELKPPAPVQDGYYGIRVRARGDRMIVGAQGDTAGAVTKAGAAYVYVRTGTTWTLEAKLTSPAPAQYEEFANAVDIDGDTAVAASWKYNAQKGAVWVFKRTGSTWSHSATLTIAGALGGIGFGRTVALDGGRLVVGGQATQKKFYVFSSLTTGSAPVATVTSPNTLPNWGHALAFEGGTIAIGCPDFAGTTSAVEVWEGSGTSFSFKQTLTYSGASFGTSVGVSGTALIAYSQNTASTIQNVGMVYRRGSSSWALEGTLSPGYAKNPNGVGAAAISGNVAIVSGTDASNHAAATVFTRSTGGAWSKLSELALSGVSGIVATSASVHGDTAVVGVHQNNTDAILRSGTVYAFHPVVAWPNGHACTDPNQCASGLCVDGYCCNTACTESCKACSVAGALGTCSAVPPGPPVGSRTCSPAKVCAAGGVCSSACTATADCATGFYCGGGTCVAKKGNGAGCGAAAECTSGSCADGVCCNSACTGQCEACDVSGKNGTCSPVLGAPRPSKTACAGATTGSDADCASSCNGVDPTKCHYPDTTKACGADACSAGLETKVGKCDGAGKCGVTSRACAPYACSATACKSSCETKADCAPGNSCKGGACVPSDSLGAACTGAGDCLDGLFCTDGVCCGVVDCGADKSCAAKADAKGTCYALQGAACTADAECASGFCVDGTCCDTRCDGQCEACDASGDGTCGPVTGAPHGARPACSAGTDACSAAACDGTDRTTCAGFKAGPAVVCSPAECDGDSLRPESTCDGKGACAAPSPSSCGRYKCDPSTTACRTSCSTTDDCAAGFSCNGGVCSTGATCSADKLSSTGPDGTKPCGAYLCGEDGDCRTTCASSSDCAPGNVCDLVNKTCAGAAAAGGGSEDSGGCALPRDRRTGGGAALALASLVALGFVSRRLRSAR